MLVFPVHDVALDTSKTEATMKKAEELVVITKTYDLILWSCNHTSRFPRQHRFALCSTTSMSRQ